MTTLRRIKLAFVAIGLVGAVVAVATEDRRITWVAIAFLAASLVIRLLDRGRPPTP